MRKIIFLAAMVFLAGCASIPTGPAECNTTTVDQYKICGWREMDPPFEYRVEFSDALQCIQVANANGFWGQPRSGIRYERVTWMVADSIIRADGVRPGAITETEPPVRITVARPWLNDGYVIHHESLHAWLGSAPSHADNDSLGGEGSFGFCNRRRYANYWQ